MRTFRHRLTILVALAAMWLLSSTVLLAHESASALADHPDHCELCLCLGSSPAALAASASFDLSGEPENPPAVAWASSHRPDAGRSAHQSRAPPSFG